jgi:hypothetical protein
VISNVSGGIIDGLGDSSSKKDEEYIDRRSLTDNPFFLVSLTRQSFPFHIFLAKK